MIWMSSPEPTRNSSVKRFVGKSTEEDGLERKELTHLEVDTKGSEELLAVDAAFVAIGHDPNTRLFKGQVEMDETLRPKFL